MARLQSRRNASEGPSGREVIAGVPVDPGDFRTMRGVVLGQHNMLERSIFAHEQFRRTIEELNLAIV